MDVEETSPRVNGTMMASMAGRSVILVGKNLGASDGDCSIQTSDGSTVRVSVPPGESFDTEFVQLFGKVTADGTLDTLRVNNMGATFDLDNYEKVVQLAKGTYSNLFE